MVEKNNTNYLLITSCLFLFAMGFEIGGFQTIISPLSKTFNLSSLQMGTLVGMQSLSTIIIPVLSGHLADIKGEKRVLMYFAPLFTAGSFLAFFAGSYSALVIGIILLGAGLSAGECVFSTFLSHVYPEDGGARAINLSQAFLCIGAVGSPLLIKFLSINWNIFFLICIILSILPLVLLTMIKQLKKPKDEEKVKLIDFSVFRESKIYLLFFIVMIIYVGLENGLGFFTTPLFSDKLGSSSGAFAISAYWLAMAVSRFINSFGKRNITRQLIVRFSLITLFLILLSFSDNSSLSIAFYAVLGFLYGPIWSFLMSKASLEIPQKAGTAMGLMSSACGIGGLSFPILMGYLSDKFTIGPSFLFLAFASVLACFIVTFVASKKIQA